MRSDAERLNDALETAVQISAAVELGWERFETDLYVRSAVIRWIQVIGEALSHVSVEMQAAHPEIRWRDAVAMRNRTVHGYFDIDLEIVWAAAVEGVPALATSRQGLVDGRSASPGSGEDD